MGDKGKLAALGLSILLAVSCQIGTYVVTPAATAGAGAADLLQVRDFETGDMSGFFWNQNAPEVVTAPHPVRAGNYSMRSYLHRYNSTYSYRTEAILAQDPNMPPDQGNDPFHFDINQEYWIGFSVFIPADFVVDTENLTDIILQIQATPDPGEDYRSPIFAISIDANDWEIISRWDSRALSPAGNNFEGSEIVYRNPLGSDIGKWTDWVIHVKWSYQDDGFLEIWRDGSRVTTRTGPNCANDTVGPRIALGVYKWPWRPEFEDRNWTYNTDWRLFYHDELRIAGANASYDDVAPGGGQPPAPPPSPPTGDNLLDNPSFESGTDSWYFYTDGEGSVSSTPPGYEGAKAASISISREGNNVQFYQNGISLKPNTRYRLDFVAYSNTARDLSIYLHKHNSPYTDYGLNNYEVNLTNVWQNFSIEFTTTNFSTPVSDARLRFWLAPYDTAADVYWIDGVSLTEVYPTPSTAPWVVYLPIIAR